MTRRAGAALIGLIAALLAVVPSAAPAWADSLARTMPAQPGPPTGLTATVVSNSEIDLSWTPPSGDPPAVSYGVLYGTASGAEDTSANSDPIQGTMYPVTGLSTCQTYYFEVQAYDADNNVGNVSSEVPAMTSCGPVSPVVTSPVVTSPSLLAPSQLTATPVSESEIDLTWAAPSGDAPAGYDVFDSTTTGQENTNSAVNGSQAVQDTAYKVTGLNVCQTYYFEVASQDSTGADVATSAEAPAKTFCPIGAIAVTVPPAAPPGSSGGQWRFIGPGLGAVAVGGALLGRRRRRKRRSRAPRDTPAPHIAPASSVHAVAHAAPPGVVVSRPTGTDPTLTVRIESHKAPSITTIEEVPPR